MNKDKFDIVSIDNNIKNKIYLIRGKQVMLDSDLAIMYGVSTTRFNEQVKRNSSKFPKDFRFQLTKSEKKVIANCDNLNNIKFSPKPPFVFTEQGVAMLSGILRSKIAINVNIQIMRAFVSMRRFMYSNLSISNRLESIEQKQIEYDSNFKKIFNIIDSQENKLKDQGIFFNGEIFDSYKFVVDLLNKAKNNVILIDNYIDTSVFTLFSKISSKINVEIYTKIDSKVKLDFKKYKSQYNNIELINFNKSHDRFLIIDNKEIYHIGASLKDLGKKWFAFSKLNIDVNFILKNLV